MVNIPQMEQKSKLIQRDKIIEYLKLHGRATVRDLTVALDINSPTKRISELVRMEYPIKKVWAHRVNSKGERKRYMIYFWEGERR